MIYFFRKTGLTVLLFLLPLLCMSGCAVMSGRHAGLSCKSCHEGSANTEDNALKNPANPSIVCRECHQYERESDHHPSSMRPGMLGAVAVIPAEFKLNHNKMECLTCHEMHAEKDNVGNRPYLLIGGPYKGRKDICRRCHQENRNVNINPHSNYGDIDRRRKNELRGDECLACHYASEGKSYSRETNLRASDAFICWKCHQVMQADFLSKHYLLKESGPTGLVGYEGLEALPDPDLNLDPFGRISCTTCHDPHRPYDAGREKGDSGRIPMRSKKLCSNCHGK